jgi:hypothetical protein
MKCVASRYCPDVAWETQYARQLAETLMRAASEEARRHQLSDACVIGALTLLLGKATGSVARRRGFELDQYVAFIVDHFTRIATAELARRSPTLQ